MAGHEIVEFIRVVIECTAMGIEILAVMVIVTAIIVVTCSRGTVRYVLQIGRPGAYEAYKHQLGKPLLLGLDLLVASDLVKTVALELTMNNVLTLGLLVLIRTFLSWSLVVEIEGRWPWEAKEGKGSESLT
ncbi:DUF1622 domain-containing protein [Pedosphaera parvula]|uniref:DUF1622 domain-containing protein n=1 Tax=Pedosphaera parvula (strain Ellin514) TaxID=320771 RepID=B9XG37_PEDPL|nr:DUF1622 domain-containing protein [Pedosphaera parvula]EEF61199.1 protein of unknown function DUF1622 [Pedosphaera parvula Ellin514]